MREYIQENPGKNAREIAQILAVSLRTAERHIKNLRDEDRIEYRGSAKTGGYFVKE